MSDQPNLKLRTPEEIEKMIAEEEGIPLPEASPAPSTGNTTAPPAATSPSPTNKLAALEAWFTHHPPTGDQAKRYTIIRGAAKGLAYLLCSMMPGGRDLDRCIQGIREVVMFANAGIATRPLEDLPAVPEQVLDQMVAQCSQ